MTDPKEFAEFAKAVLDAALEHRQQAKTKGFSDEASEAMAVTLHSVLMASLYNEADDPAPEG